jgi:glycolate oxidase FAD binding subunit
VNALDALTQRLERLAGPVGEARPRFDVEPLPMVAPGTIEQVVELLRLAARDALRVIPLGLGSKLGRCGIPGHADFMLSTRGLTRVVSHVPDDGTITVEAGTTMAALVQRCRAGGHFLTPDVAQPDAKTIGGVVAAGESGFDRLRFGPVRHHVLGTRAALADGTLAKSGGQLVKNVTGFDLHRLYCGSHGTLCVIVEVSLRLFPEPEHELWIETRAATIDEALELAQRALALPARIVSLAVEAPRDSKEAWRVCARLFGRRAPVEAERAMIVTAWTGCHVLEGPAARVAANRASAAMSFAGSAHPRFQVTCAPTKCLDAVRIVQRSLRDHASDGSLSLQPGVAQIDVEVRCAPDRLAQLATATRGALAKHGATLELHDAPRGALLGLDPFGEPSPGLELMRALQRQLDPHGVFRTGRFHGGL